MPHTIEYAASGRAKCRGCGEKIAKGELRFGERLPNAFGDGEMTLWFHVRCGAFKRPEPFLEFLADDEWGDVAEDDREGAKALQASAEDGMNHRRLPRVDGASRAPTGRARCRSCKELIEKGSWRIGLTFFEDYGFQPAGFIHAGCAAAYFETTALFDRLKHFTPSLSAADMLALEADIGLS
ncbi:MAG: hypothetical protein AAF417_00720 [Pseudomonadota bacterium]